MALKERHLASRRWYAVASFWRQPPIFIVIKVELPQEAHGYSEGSQQISDTLWRPSKHPTSVFFLMSERAAAACPVSIPKERRLREAFGRPV